MNDTPPHRASVRWLAVVAATVFAWSMADGPRSLGAPAISDPIVAPRMLLLDVAAVGQDVIAVGERGTIIRSSDQGRTWQSVKTPTRATLTGVSFATLTAPRLGWAVGHDAIILATNDAGRSWTKQYQGEELEDSFLDVLAFDATRVIAVGARGLCMITTDGGRTWTRHPVSNDNPHLNRITRGPGGTLYLAGERGTLLRSSDQGGSWTPMRSPYQGSFYGILPLERRVLLAYGLRGHVYHSADDGASWTAVAAPQPVLLTTAVRLRSGVILLAGQAHAMLQSRDQGQTLVLSPRVTESAIAELLELSDGTVLAAGETGAVLVSEQPPNLR